ncbi:putative membrane protein yuiD [Senna tora]|uniref:Putative membrane protein yuiD n=1 Tax=Senna tora TaxID=362788 RepID=A0A834X0E7_9FABA|nr:putative membrane protein yuiD [Senna tora]
MTMILLHSSFLGLPPSSFLSPNQQVNLILPQYRPPKSKPSSFKITSLTAISIDDIVQLAHNKVLIAAGASAAIGQLSKPFTSVFLYGKEFDVKAVVQAGGFPSTHSSATVASATFLGLERGFSDPIFGVTVVYAGLIMYDAQGVRREVGNHAKILNKIILQMQKNSVGSKDRDDGLINSEGTSTSLNVQGLKNSFFSQETNSSETQPRSASMLVESDGKRRETNEELSKLAATGLIPLKESIGHTEVEVIAGALLGFLVGLAVYNFM